MESKLGLTGHSIFTIKEYLMTWPKDVKVSRQWKHHSIKLVGIKLFKPTQAQQGEVFVSNYTFNGQIDGTVLSLGMQTG